MKGAIYTDDRPAVNAANVLGATVRLWFLVAISGQLLLAAYVAWFYGGTGLQGQVAAWSGVLTKGIIRGDAAGNAAVIGHLIAALILTVGGAIQLIPQARRWAPRFHRLMGRVYVVTAIAASITGMYLTWIRGTRGDLVQHIGGTLNALLIIVCAVLALHSAITRRFDAHRRWVLRLFIVVSGAWFYRVGLFLWILINDGPAAFDVVTWRGPALTFISFANTLVPLAVLELYLRTQSNPTAPRQLGMAAALFVLTIVMGIGIFGATVGMWLPIIRTGQLPG